MPHFTIAFGIILIVLGVAGWFGGGRTSFTALIPALFGLPLLLLGLLALRPAARKHAMHAAVIIAVVGLAGSLMRPVRLLIAGDLAWGLPLAIQLTMAALCVVFIVAAVRSFAAARRARSGGNRQ